MTTMFGPTVQNNKDVENLKPLKSDTKNSDITKSGVRDPASETSIQISDAKSDKIRDHEIW